MATVATGVVGTETTSIGTVVVLVEKEEDLRTAIPTAGGSGRGCRLVVPCWEAAASTIVGAGARGEGTALLVAVGEEPPEGTAKVVELSASEFMVKKRVWLAVFVSF